MQAARQCSAGMRGHEAGPWRRPINLFFSHWKSVSPGYQPRLSSAHRLLELPTQVALGRTLDLSTLGEQWDPSFQSYSATTLLRASLEKLPALPRLHPISHCAASALDVKVFFVSFMTAAFLYLVPFCWAIDPQSLLIISADPRTTHEPLRAISRYKPPSPQQPPPKRTPCILPTPSNPLSTLGPMTMIIQHIILYSYQNPLFVLFLLFFLKNKKQ